MTDATASRPSSKPGFSSRWMLDSSSRQPAANVPGDANALASAIDTDGDGVADTLAVRVDAERPTVAARVGGWIARSIVTLLLVAALVAAAAGGAAYLQAQDELDRTTAQLEAEQVAAAEARAATVRLEARVAELEGAALEAERDALAAENDVLRRMLLESERRTADAR
jgi:hypothetical protein